MLKNMEFQRDDFPTAITSLSYNQFARYALWEYMSSDWETVVERYDKRVPICVQMCLISTY